MVETITFTEKVLNILEKYLMQKTNFSLGANYDLVLLYPNDSGLLDEDLTLLVSAKVLDNETKTNLILGVSNFFRENLEWEDYLKITRFTFIKSDNQLVKNINSLFFKEKIITINSIWLNSTFINSGNVLKSFILQKLKKGNNVILEDYEGKRITAQIIEVDKNYDVLYWTQKAITENRHLSNENKREALLQNGYLAKINFDEIYAIK